MIYKRKMIDSLNKVKNSLEMLMIKLERKKYPDMLLSETNRDIMFSACNGRIIRCFNKEKISLYKTENHVIIKKTSGNFIKCLRKNN